MIRDIALSSRHKIFWLSIFAIAMAYLEAAVVVYLRLIFYPEGFDFPLSSGSKEILFIELGREAATMFMLVAIGFLLGRSKIERFAYLLMCFGIWDIFYYIWLKIQIGWPASLMTWDLLFLIPLPWVSPVIAPVLVSVVMIWAGLWIVKRQDQGIEVRFPLWAWSLEILAGLIIIISFVWDFQNIIAQGNPHPFRWDIYAAGLIIGIALFTRLMLNPNNMTSENS